MTLQIRKLLSLALRLIPLSLVILTLGCGGGGSGPTSSGPTQTQHIGPVGISFVGHPGAPISATSNQVAAAGEAGASFVTLSFNPAHNVNSTLIAFTRQVTGEGDQMYTIAPAGSSASLLLHQGTNGYPTYRSKRSSCVRRRVRAEDAITTMLGDGSQQKVVVSSVTAIPAISPNGTTIAYSASDHNIYTVPSSGGTPTKIYSGGLAELDTPVWSPSGTQISFTFFNEATSSDNVFTMTSTGANLTNVTPSADQMGSMIVNSWSPDGATLACAYRPNGASNYGVGLLSPTGAFLFLVSPTAVNDSLPTFSPDGSEIAFYRGSTGEAIPGLYVSDYAGTNTQLLLPDPTTGATGLLASTCWSPFQASKNFVGAGGTITASPVAGFLVSQNSSQFASLLTFTATTPSTATISQSASNVNGAPLIFSLGADSITNISYANVYSGAHSSIPLTATPSALVTIDAGTGLVDYVIPAVEGKAHPAVAQSKGTSLTYSGQFSAIYDGTGKNLAPSGALTIEFDRTTGKLLSFR